MTKKIDEMLAEEGDAAERYELPEELPTSVMVSRPNIGRSAVVSVRLSGDEHDQLQQAAKDARLPVSTLIRILALERLHAKGGGANASVSERLARLEKAVFDRSA